MQRIEREAARRFAFDWRDEPLLRVRPGESFEVETFDASSGYFRTEADRAVPALRPGLAFLSVHFHEQVATNDLTIEAVDPKSGTSEFKATAIRIDKTQEN